MSLGIRSIVPTGRTLIGKTAIAGKGCVGLVVKARTMHGPSFCALKIRRVDADRKDMHNEGRLHLKANSAGVGPVIHNHSDNFLTMEFVEGKSILEWAGQSDLDDAPVIARSIMEDCYRLDCAGLDHGELSRIDRHVIVSEESGRAPRATIIDFESASTLRKTANVTSAAQALFLGDGLVAKSLRRRILGEDYTKRPDARQDLIRILREYKDAKTEKNFARLLSALQLEQ